MTDYVLGTITVTKIATPDDVVVTVDLDPDDLPVVDALGMLTLAVDTVLHHPDPLEGEDPDGI